MLQELLLLYVVESRDQHASQLLTVCPGWPHSDI
jgi:hypothetical protein